MLALERGASRQALEQHAPERKHVRSRVHVARAHGLLGRHVADGPEHRARLRQATSPPGAARDPEVEHLHPLDVALDQEQIARLQITMNDALRVRDG